MRLCKPRFIVTALVTMTIAIVNALPVSSQPPLSGCTDTITSYETYHLIQTPDGLGLSQTKNNACQVLAKADELMTHNLSTRIDPENAQQLMLRYYQEKIENAGGAIAYGNAWSQHLESLSPGSVPYLRAESKWALEQLGVTIPAGVHIIGAKGIPTIPQTTPRLPEEN